MRTSRGAKSIRRALGIAIGAAAILAICGESVRAQATTSFVYTLRVGTASGSLATSVFFDGQFIWATVQNPGGGQLEKIDLTGVVISSTGVGITPIAMAYDGANIWVTNYNSSTVTVVNASNGQRVKTITLAPGSNPEGVLFDGKYVWVANNGVGANSVSKFDISDQSLIATYGVGLSPDDLAFDGTSIWVTNSENNDVWKINRETGAFIINYAVGLFPLSIIYDGKYMWVGNGTSVNVGPAIPGASSLTKIRAADGVVVGTYTVGNHVRGLVFDGTSIWECNGNDNTVSRLRSADVALVGTYATGMAPRAVAFDGSKIWVANAGQNTLTVISPTSLAADAAAAALGRPVNRPYPGRSRQSVDGLAGGAVIVVSSRKTIPGSQISPILNRLLDDD